jgi:hypothetical protein
MEKNTKQTLLNGFESLAVSFWYSSLFGIAFILIVNGLGIHTENVILLLVGFWMLFMLIEIMWVRYESKIRELLNEKNK